VCSGSVKTASRSCSVPAPLPIYLPHTYCVTQPASISSHAPSPPMPPLVPPPKNFFEMQENINHNAGTRHDSPIPISLTNTYSLTLCYPTSVYLLTYTPHSQYIHPHSRVPTGVDLPIYASHSQYIPPYSPRPNQRGSPHIPPPPLKIHTPSFSCPNRRRSLHIRIPLTIHTSLFSATQPALISSHTPPHKIHTASFSYPNQRQSPHIRIPLTVHTTLFSATQPASISSHTPTPVTIHTASFSCPNRRRSPHIHPVSPLFLPQHCAWAWVRGIRGDTRVRVDMCVCVRVCVCGCT